MARDEKAERWDKSSWIDWANRRSNLKEFNLDRRYAGVSFARPK
jgi:hypothetical protein